MYLLSLGYDNTAIGEVATCTALMNFLMQYSMGKYADRMQSAKKLLIILFPASVFVTGFLYFMHGNILSVILAVLPISLLDFSAMGQLDTYTLASSDINPAIHYSTMRAVGGLTGAVISTLFGILYEKIGLSYMFLFHGGFMLTAAFSLRFLLETKKQNRDDPYQGNTNPGIRKPRIGLLPWFMILFSGCVVFLGWRANVIYLPVLLRDARGTSLHQGIAMAIMSISSIPILLIFPRLIRRYSLSRLMIIGGIIMVLRMIIVPFIKSAETLMLVQVLEGGSYAILQPAIMEMISQYAAEHIRGRIVALWTGIQMALTTIIANMIVNGFSSLLRLRDIFMIFSIITGIGIVLLMISYGILAGTWRERNEVQ